MPRFLAIDVGAGTLDAMFFDTESGDQFKFVAKSPTRVLAERILGSRRQNILITGRQMGGGPVTEAIRTRARDCRIMMTRSAAETVHHRMERIRRVGVVIISKKAAEREAKRTDLSWFRTGDVRPDNIVTILKAMGVESTVDYLGVSVQDHGTPKDAVSSVDFRHHMFREIIDRCPKPSAFLFHAKQIPSYLRRMRAVAMDARGIPSREIYVMDTGMAAVLGASSDPSVQGRNPIIVLDVATSHTLGALLMDREIAGLFEYHTSTISPALLRSLTIDLAEGNLSHEQVVSEGGHGAHMRKAVGFNQVERILVTGPKRRILNHAGIDRIVLGAPFGDNMMTGAAGLILAIAEREGVSIH